MSTEILVCNVGSSNLRTAFFSGSRPVWRKRVPNDPGGHDRWQALLDALGSSEPDAIGHRVVHGGGVTEPARLLDAAEIARLSELIALAPLHQPAALELVDHCSRRFPGVPQYACFDTAFHGNLPDFARRWPVPNEFKLYRYGFHGLSYAHAARVMPQILPNAAELRILVAHLGGGSSLCLLDHLRSIDTTMGLTPLGGLPMATRSGDLDPGVVLALVRQIGLVAAERTLYQDSGLLAWSDGESGDMATLLASPTAGARFAVDAYVRALRAGIGAMAAKAGGLDALVFTGGIGEGSATMRAAVCAGLDFLGFSLDVGANDEGQTRLNTVRSKPVVRLGSDEEWMIRCYTEAALMSAEFDQGQ